MLISGQYAKAGGLRGLTRRGALNPSGEILLKLAQVRQSAHLQSIIENTRYAIVAMRSRSCRVSIGFTKYANAPCRIPQITSVS